MDSNFWDQLELCKKSSKCGDSFVANYQIISQLVSNKMYSDDIGDMFCNFVGSDDGHDDLCDFIIWNGKQATTEFLLNPKSAIPLAKSMGKDPGFDGDINSLQRIICNI